MSTSKTLQRFVPNHRSIPTAFFLKFHRSSFLAGSSSNKRPYAVVFFPDENSTSVVPVSWLTPVDEQSNIYKCKWPATNYISKSSRGVKPDQKWREYTASVKHYSKTWDSGNAYVEKYQYTSDVDIISSDDVSANRKLKSPVSSPPVCSNPPAVGPSPSMQDFNRFEAKIDCLLQQMTDMSAEISLLKEKTATLKSIETLKDLDLRIDDFKRLESLDEVQDFEQQLKCEDEFSKAVKRCGFLGGRDYKEAIRRILQKLFSHTVALSLCWNCTGPKTSLQKFPNILLFITVSLRSNPLFKGVTQNDIEDVVKRWLRYASDRNGGRFARMMRKKNQLNASNDDVMKCNDESLSCYIASEADLIH